MSAIAIEMKEKPFVEAGIRAAGGLPGLSNGSGDGMRGGGRDGRGERGHSLDRLCLDDSLRNNAIISVGRAACQISTDDDLSQIGFSFSRSVGSLCGKPAPTCHDR